MKKKKLHVLLMVVVALALLIVVAVAIARQFDTAPADPHAGHNHAAGETHDTALPTTQPTKNLKAFECYSVKKDKNDTYSYVVKNHKGNVMYSEENLAVKPQISVIDDAMLSVYGMDSKHNNLSGWAMFFNVQNMGNSQRFRNVLAVVDDHVAYLEHRSGKWYVFVSDPYGGTQYFEGTELPGLAIQKSGNPELEYSVTKSGDLKVTYATDKDKKSVTVKMGE